MIRNNGPRKPSASEAIEETDCCRVGGGKAFREQFICLTIIMNLPVMRASVPLWMGAGPSSRMEVMSKIGFIKLVAIEVNKIPEVTLEKGRDS